LTVETTAACKDPCEELAYWPVEAPWRCVGRRPAVPRIWPGWPSYAPRRTWKRNTIPTSSLLASGKNDPHKTSFISQSVLWSNPAAAD